MKSHNLLSRLPPSIINQLRNLRTAAYWLLEPLDWAARRINLLEHYPPLALRRHVGFLGDMGADAAEFTAYLRLLAGMGPSSHVLDLGAGCGKLELALENVIGPEGRCVAVDIHRPSIQWAQRTIGTRHPHFQFVHADIHHESYWPSGRLDARQFFADFRETDFDLVIAKSLFTHMLPAELGLYLHEAARRLKPGGIAFFTFFLLRSEQPENHWSEKSQLTFAPYPPAPPCWVRYVNSPPSAVAYPESYIRTQLEAANLHIQNNYRGTWSGDKDGLGFQDIIIAKKM
jgi:ubiquinone/menaquinone biosynthesis C-methylase UbiE